MYIVFMRKYAKYMVRLCRLWSFNIEDIPDETLKFYVDVARIIRQFLISLGELVDVLLNY